jgi:hypothetical protein
MSSVVTTNKSTDSAAPTREFFNRYFTQSINFPSNQVDAVVGFFENRGFEKAAAASVATVLLEQAKIDSIDIFDLLENLKSFDKTKLTALTTAILNANRSAISKLGYRETNVTNTTEARNILF